MPAINLFLRFNANNVPLENIAVAVRVVRIHEVKCTWKRGIVHVIRFDTGKAMPCGGVRFRTVVVSDFRNDLLTILSWQELLFLFETNTKPAADAGLTFDF